MTRVMVTSNENETIAAGEELAQEISKIKTDRSIIIFLEGELGAGKTTFTKGILKSLNQSQSLSGLKMVKELFPLPILMFKFHIKTMGKMIEESY